MLNIEYKENINEEFYKIIDEEFNKFAMFFTTDVKNYNTATVSGDTLELTGGPVYKYQDNSIYRNDVVIAENILECNFTLSTYEVDTTSKNIVNVNMQIGESAEDSINESVDFTLRYW